MKKGFLLTFCLLSLNASARPIVKESPALRSDLRLVTKDGNPIYTFVYENNVLTQNQIKDKVSSFLYERRTGQPCPPGVYCIQGENYYSIQFENVKVGQDRCGSLKYSAVSLDRKVSLQVVDHRTRRCDDYKQDRWEITISEKGMRRYFRGNPESIAQTDCERYVRNTICTMQYMPVSCSVQSVNWEPITPGVSAMGSNSCFAEAELKKKVCERSYNADKLQEGEIVCIPQSN